MKRLQPLDKSGREIHSGDLIIYGSALGRSATLQYGKIVAIKFKSDREFNRDKKEWEDVEVPRYTVQGVSTWSWASENASLLQKGTLSFGDRILILHRDQLPKAVLDILDGVIVPSPTQE